MRKRGVVTAGGHFSDCQDLEDTESGRGLMSSDTGQPCRLHPVSAARRAPRSSPDEEKVERRLMIVNIASELPEKSKTQPGEDGTSLERSGILRQARKRASGPFRCDWCGLLKSDIYRTGSRICHDCWETHVRERRAEAMAIEVAIFTQPAEGGSR